LTGNSTPAARSSSTIEVVAAGFKDPVGVAVDPDGSIVVSDRKAGTITQISTNGRRTVLVSRLEGPAGVAFDPDGGLLIVEQRGRRVLRRDPSGSLAVLAFGIVVPRWTTTAPDGTIYLSAKGLTQRRKQSTKNGARGKGMRIMELLPSGRLLTVADGLQGLEGLAWADGMLYAAVTRMPTDRGKNRTRTVLFLHQSNNRGRSYRRLRRRCAFRAHRAARIPYPVCPATFDSILDRLT
jgi:DNA-binding beta-propeller fold protein YncE